MALGQSITGVGDGSHAGGVWKMRLVQVDECWGRKIVKHLRNGEGDNSSQESGLGSGNFFWRRK